MMLRNKIAIIYGAGGAIGSTIAETFAREGAKVFLTGRTKAKVDLVAEKINTAGGFAEAAEVDALDEQAIKEHLNMVIAKAGNIDISFNAIGLRNTTLQGVPLVDLDVSQFMAPSAELGPHGVRAVGLRPQGMPESDTIKEVHSLHAKANGMTFKEFNDMVESRTHRRRLLSLQEMAEVAAFMACDRASAMTGTMVNMSLGVIAD